MERLEPRRAVIAALAILAFASASGVERMHAAQQDGASNAATSFVVRFASDHPLGRAQTLEALAVSADAERAALSAMEMLPELRGLCFERFTLNGVEVVLSVCEATPLEQTRDMQALWMDRFGTMEGVERAAPNAISVSGQS
jgi:hypothetical protein